jgi:hypothetical protein
LRSTIQQGHLIPNQHLLAIISVPTFGCGYAALVNRSPAASARSANALGEAQRSPLASG